MTRNQQLQATEREKKQAERRLAAELTAEFDIPFVTWEDFEQALVASTTKPSKV